MSERYKYKQYKFLAPEQLHAALAEVVALAKKEGVHMALAGGYAMQQYGSPRLTGDVDVVASETVRALKGKALTFGGRRTKATAGVPVDIIVRSDDAKDLYEAALASAVNIGGPCPVVRPEFMAAIKLEAGRKKDEDDLEFLIVARRIDIPKARAIIKQYLGWFAAKEFDSYVAEAQWKASREK